MLVAEPLLWMEFPRKANEEPPLVEMQAPVAVAFGQDISLPARRMPVTLPIDTAVCVPRRMRLARTQLLPVMLTPVVSPVVAPIVTELAG